MSRALAVLQEEPALAVYADVLSHAVTGELIGMANFASMVPLCTSVAEQLDAVGHAESERRHAMAFRAVARDLDVQIIEDPWAKDWLRVRAAFQRQVAAGDLLSCVIAQELMLEAFAIPMYTAVAEVSTGRIAQTFGAIAREEQQHLAHAIERLRPVLEQDRDACEARIEVLHFEVMAILAEMLTPSCIDTSCGLCGGVCLKTALGNIGLSVAALRGRALRSYLQALDALGVRGERSLEWIANLPA